MSNITGDAAGSFSSGNTAGDEEVQPNRQLHQRYQQQQQQLQLQDHFHGSNSGPSTTTNSNGSISPQQQQPPVKKKRNLPGTPDPNAEIIALSPKTLMTTNRFVCEICNKGFQRDQNLQLHRRGHNLPWKLKQRTGNEIRKRVYLCPEPTCVHHNPTRALGDLTGVKKHFSRKHGEKKWKCDKCSKKYAVQSDWKAHSKSCGTKEYKCDCGTIFSRRDSFITHRAFCDALTEENNKVSSHGLTASFVGNLQGKVSKLMSSMPLVNDTSLMGIPDEFNQLQQETSKNPVKSSLPHHQDDLMSMELKSPDMTAGGGMFSSSCSSSLFGGPPRNIASSSSSTSCLHQLSANNSSSSSCCCFDNGLHGSNKMMNGGGIMIAGWSSAHMLSATALLQKAAQMGATASNTINSSSMMQQENLTPGMAAGPDDHDQLSSGMITTSSYRGEMPQQHQNIQPQTDQQTQLAKMDGGGLIFNNNYLMQKAVPQRIMSSQFFDAAAPSSRGVNDIGMFSGMFMGGAADQNHGVVNKQLKNNTEHDHHDEINGSSSSTSNRMIQGRSIINGNNSGLGGMPKSTGQNPAGATMIFGGDDMMTVDFLGIGGGGSISTNLHEQHQELHPFGQADMEKSLWDI